MSEASTREQLWAFLDDSTNNPTITNASLIMAASQQDITKLTTISEPEPIHETTISPANAIYQQLIAQQQNNAEENQVLAKLSENYAPKTLTWEP
jgi:hypothetical protein